jgi:post-segregation antitoxin (ccd killing protein)
MKPGMNLRSPVLVGPDTRQATLDVKTLCLYTQRMPLLNVRLDAEDQRLADQLRAEGIPIARLVREAIRSEHARRLGHLARKQKPSQLIAGLLAQFPDPPGTESHGIDTTDRHAVQRHIAARLRGAVR